MVTIKWGAVGQYMILNIITVGFTLHFYVNMKTSSHFRDQFSSICIIIAYRDPSESLSDLAGRRTSIYLMLASSDASLSTSFLKLEFSYSISSDPEDEEDEVKDWDLEEDLG